MFVLPNFLTFITIFNTSILYTLPVYTDSTFCRANRWQPVVHSGFNAAGQLVTLVYMGMINDDYVCAVSKYGWISGRICSSRLTLEYHLY